MQYSSLMSIGLVVAVLSSGTAHGQSADSRDDIRCIVAAISSMNIVKDTAMKGSLQVSALYYLGRLDGREPTLDLEKSLLNELSKMNAKDVGAEDQRCGKQLASRGQAFANIGKDIMQKGRAQSSN